MRRFFEGNLILKVATRTYVRGGYFFRWEFFFLFFFFLTKFHWDARPREKASNRLSSRNFYNYETIRWTTSELVPPNGFDSIWRFGRELKCRSIEWKERTEERRGEGVCFVSASSNSENDSASGVWSFSSIEGRGGRQQPREEENCTGGEGEGVSKLQVVPLINTESEPRSVNHNDSDSKSRGFIASPILPMSLAVQTKITLHLRCSAARRTAFVRKKIYLDLARIIRFARGT